MSKITFGDKTNLYPVVDEQKQITAENINEIKSSVNALYENPNNGTAPTLSTVGYLGEVRFDIAGKCWMLRKIDGSTYTWERLFTDIVLTQTEYDAIVTKDPNARYMIVGA